MPYQNAVSDSRQQKSKCHISLWTLRPYSHPVSKKMTPDSTEERQKFLQGRGGRRRDEHKAVLLDTDDASSFQGCDVSGPVSHNIVSPVS